jgi:hypothetical protein
MNVKVSGAPELLTLRNPQVVVSDFSIASHDSRRDASRDACGLEVAR